MNSPSQQYNRLDYLDAVRAFALILGIAFHASLSFMPVFIGWAVMDISTSAIVSVFMTISHSFRMELFFLIAGFFSHMKFHSHGVRAFLTSRLVRIAIPFVLGWPLLRPLLVSAWIMGSESMRGEVDICSSFQTGFATLGDIPQDLLIGTHLWFLYYLLLISVSMLVIRLLIGLNKTVHSQATQLADTLIRWLCHSRLAIIVLAIPSAVCLWSMEYWGVDTPDRALTPHVPVSLIYGGFFLFGWLLHRHASLMEHFARLTWSKFILCLMTIVITTLLAGFAMQFSHPHYLLLKTGFVLSYALMMWSLVSLTIGIFKRVLDRPNKLVRYIADSSYWLYLIHLPIVIWLQIAFAEIAIHWSIKLVAIIAITLTISLLLYDLLIRSTMIGAVLNGKRRPRVLFSQFKGEGKLWIRKGMKVEEERACQHLQ